jgi:hypothetical protein
MNGKFTNGCKRIEVGSDTGEGAFGAGNDFVGAKAFEDFGKFVEIAANNDMGFLVAVAGAFGDEKSGLDVVGSDDDEPGTVDAGVGERTFLFGVVDDNGFAITNEVIDGGGVFVDQNIGLLPPAEMFDDAHAEMGIANDDGVILHLLGEHAATFLRIVALQSLQQEDGNDDAEEDALAPEGIESPERIRAIPEIDSVEKGFAQGEMFPVAKSDRTEGKPEGDKSKAPAALAQEDGQANPEKAAHGVGWSDSAL